MRVLFDGYWWAEGPISNRTAQRQMVLAWQQEFPGDELYLAVPSGRWDLSDVPSSVHVVRTFARLQALINRFELPTIARRLGVDLILTHNFAAGPRSAVFIHDLMFLEHREWFTWLENRYFRLMLVFARGAGQVLTSSESEARRVSRWVGRAAVPVGLALDPDLTAAEPSAPGGGLKPGQYCLTVGRLNVRKNLNNVVLGAFKSGSITAEFPLVVVGERSGKGSVVDLSDPRVRFIERVSSAELRWLFENAALFIFLSLDEGFGLPALEAKHFGAPALLSDIPIFHEVFGPGGDYVHPTDIPRIAMEIARLAGAGRTALGVSGAELPRSWSLTVRSIRSAAMGEG